MNPKLVQQQLNLAEEPDFESLELLEGLEDRPARVHPSSVVLLTPFTFQDMPPEIGNLTESTVSEK